MTYTLRTKHPDVETFIKTFETLGDARDAYLSVGTIPGGFRTITDKDGAIVWSDYQPMNGTKDVRIAGEFSAYTLITETVKYITVDDRMDPERLALFKTFLRSSIRNAMDCDCPYSVGVADAMGMVYRLVSIRDEVSPEYVRELRLDVEKLRFNAREAMA